jgi:hypothetical protein
MNETQLLVMSSAVETSLNVDERMLDYARTQQGMVTVETNLKCGRGLCVPTKYVAALRPLPH